MLRLGEEMLRDNVEHIEACDVRGEYWRRAAIFGSVGNQGWMGT